MADVLVKKDIDQSDLVKNQKEPKSKLQRRSFHLTLGEHLIDLKNGVNLKVFLEGSLPAFLIT